MDVAVRKRRRGGVRGSSADITTNDGERRRRVLHALSVSPYSSPVLSPLMASSAAAGSAPEGAATEPKNDDGQSHRHTRDHLTDRHCIQ